MNQAMKKWGILTLLALWLALAVFAWCKPATDISEAERRKLAQFPEISLSAIRNGIFASGFESYATDQFPLREFFRSIKSRFHLQILGQLDSNDIYLAQGYAAKIEYPLSSASLSHARDRIGYVYDKYLKNTDCRVLLSIVPDKGYYLAADNGYPALDYEALVESIRAAADFDSYIDLFRQLEGWLEKDTYVPLPGDIIYYAWDEQPMGDCTGWADHVGIVVGVRWPFVKVIEGNMDDCVGYRTITIWDKTIRGYGTPDYS